MKLGDKVTIACIIAGCNCHAEIKKGKRRLTYKCQESGHMNFQTKQGQEKLAALFEQHSKDERVSETLDPKSEPRSKDSEDVSDEPQSRRGFRLFKAGR